MKTLVPLCIVSLALLAQSALGQNATTTPVGVITVDLPKGSDTIIATPLAKAESFRGAVTSRTGFAITVSPSPAWGSFTTTPHYIQAVDGAQAGVFFDVASNTADTITLVDNGLAPTGLDAGTNFKVVEYWTLGTLFPASSANVSFTPSLSTLVRRTLINFPNVVGTGINRSSSATYFFYGSYWRNVSTAGVDANNTPILPDSYITVRNPTTAADGLKLTVTGSVNLDPISIPLDSIAGAPNDNFVSMSRPVDVTLNDLGLISSGAFTASPSTLIRKDQLLVFNNATIGINKSASATYFYTGGTWRSTANAGVDAGTTTIPAGSGIIIRKATAASPASAFWKNEIVLAP
ncbi:MAG: TIGR02597 family protein [Verrucomicrobiae bacterium]